jgi:hypothetical protein
VRTELLVDVAARLEPALVTVGRLLGGKGGFLRLKVGQGLLLGRNQGIDDALGVEPGDYAAELDR